MIVEVEREIDGGVFEPYQMIRFQADLTKGTDCQHDIYASRVVYDVSPTGAWDAKGKDIYDTLSPHEIEWLIDEVIKEYGGTL